jgi:hypothetical protein
VYSPSAATNEFRLVLYAEAGILGGSMDVRREAVVEAACELGGDVRSSRDEDAGMLREATLDVMVGDVPGW